MAPPPDEAKADRTSSSPVPDRVDEGASESEETFRRLIESSPDFITRYDETGALLYANPTVERFLGMPLAELQSRPSPDRDAGNEWRSGFSAKIREAIQTGRPSEYEPIWPGAAGAEPVHHHVQFIPLLDGEGRVESVAAYGRDVTRVRAAERALAAANANLRQILDALPDCVWLKGADGRYRGCNPAFERLTGRAEDGLVGKTDAELFPAEQALAFRERDQEVLGGRPSRTDEDWVSPADGGPAVLLETVRTRVADPDGVRVSVLGVSRDVTRQRAAEDLLYKREQEFRALVENAPDPVCRYDPAGHRVYVNPAFMRLFPVPTEAGYRERKPLGPLASSTGEWARLQEAIRAVASDEAPRLVELSWKGLDGVLRWYQVTVVAEHDRSGAVETVLAIGRDITALKRSEEELRKLSRAVEQSPASILITDTEGVIEYVNPKFCEVSGYAPAEVVGRKPSLLKSGETPPEEYARLWETIRAGDEWRGEFHNRKKSGELFWESASISPVLGPNGRITHFLAVKEDITERKRLEEEIRRAQKMEAFGQLAGGVAHDFNNVLTVIQVSAAALEEPDLPAANRVALVREIREASDRAARLTRQLLLFSRKKPAQLRPLDLNEVVAETAGMLRRVIGEHVSLETRLAPGGAPVRADLGMMEQVLMNLVVNARDAMPQGGRVLVTTRVEPAIAGEPTSDQVCLTVRDTGRGIAPEHLPHVFEPFFTTKDVGKGTGLGLATVFGIVQQHGGTVEVQSALGEGTAVEIRLPRTSEAAPRRAREAEALPDASGRRQTGETLLLVEDDPAVRALVRRVLGREGYRVLEATSAVAALELWADRRGEIDLVLTDVVMPGGINGWELGERLLRDRPDLPIIYSSGYAEDVLGDASALRGASQLLDKPYDPAALVRAVRACLDQAREGSERG